MLASEVHVWHGELDRGDCGLALCRLLAGYLDEDPAAIELRCGERGKPALSHPRTSLRFNLSHSGGVALIALAAEREVGVDVERIRPRRNLLGLAERALDPEAAAALRAAPEAERLAAFHLAWTRHEAIAKCHGTGLWVPLPPGPVAVTELAVGGGFAAALAVAGSAMAAVRRFALASGAGQELSRHLATPR